MISEKVKYCVRLESRARGCCQLGTDYGTKKAWLLKRNSLCIHGFIFVSHPQLRDTGGAGTGKGSVQETTEPLHKHWGCQYWQGFCTGDEPLHKHWGCQYWQGFCTGDNWATAQALGVLVLVRDLHRRQLSHYTSSHIQSLKVAFVEKNYVKNAGEKACEEKVDITTEGRKVKKEMAEKEEPRGQRRSQGRKWTDSVRSGSTADSSMGATPCARDQVCFYMNDGSLPLILGCHTPAVECDECWIKFMDKIMHLSISCNTAFLFQSAFAG